MVKPKIPCPECDSKDVRRANITPLLDIWVCYNCYRAQFIHKKRPKKVKLEKSKWYRVDDKGQVWEITDNLVSPFEFRGVIE